MKTIAKITVAILIAVTLIVVVLIALLGVGANEVAKDIEADHAKDAEYAMTVREYRALDLGTTYDEVIAEHGKPIPGEGVEATLPGGVEQVIVHYNVEGGDLFGFFQIEFIDGALSSKMRVD